MNSKIAIFSFFSGSGLLDLGFEKSGFDIVFVNEHSASFINAYAYSRKKMNMCAPEYGYHNTDINEYMGGLKKNLRAFMSDAKKNNEIVGFIGGPPCPDFSIGGKNNGRDGESGKLSSTYVNLIISEKPDFFIFENVKGLWRTGRHRKFYQELTSDLHNVGYCTTEHMMNALAFGVPQDRDRLLLFGVRKGKMTKDFYYQSEMLNFPWSLHADYKLDHVKSICWPKTDEFSEESQKEPDEGIVQELTVQHWFEKNDVLNHPNASAYFKPRAGLARMLSIDEGDVSKKSYKRLHRWRYSPTAAYGNNEVHLHPYKARRISVSEALAIQSLPKEFMLPDKMSLSDMFKTIGNGVPYLLSKALASTIRGYLDTAVKK